MAAGQGSFITVLLIRWLVITAAIVLASSLLPGIHVASLATAFLAAAILGVLNTFLRPVLLLLTLPLTILTLGIFAFVLNALMLILVAYFVPGLEIDGFFWAFLGALIVSIASWLANRFIYQQQAAPRGKPDVIDLERGDDGKWR
ncbi:MAG: phage holin family protein [Smithellaceae bacterium]|jgi:putative membrane protein|nr:phage holin family protein [Smithellaceae bacterium]MDD3258977.1 phage holin family protein [Smithellaceae bacterium]MDD3848977.1 phage holin family protein [Smithellaceae bacterium]HOG11349.1 phage holin family protein [Smithellaceae bacterium]HOQ72079.1 phage holin family protein [Smithellaceae bacterium]